MESAIHFTAITTNGVPIVSYLWDVNNSITSIETIGQQNQYLYNVTGTQTLQLISVSNHDCWDTSKRMVFINPVPTPHFTVDNSSGCPEHCVEFINATPNTSPVATINDWYWNFGNGEDIHSKTMNSQHTCYTNNSHSVVAPFNVTLTVKTDSGCVASVIKNNFITVYPTPVANFTLTPDLGNVVEPQVAFTNQSQDYTKWYWMFGDSNNLDSVNSNPTHYYQTNDATYYYAVLTVQNQYGCQDTAKHKVTIEPEFMFYIPNTFSPNNDDVNDEFTGVGIGILEYELRVFDRWGAKVFQSNDIKQGWNGKMRGYDEDCKEDVYTWKVELKNVFKKSYNYVGHITLLR